MSDAQDRAEAIDGDKVAADYPPEQPWGVDEPEVTPEGEWAQETFEERTARQEPDGNADWVVVQPYTDPAEDVVDDEPQAVAEAQPPATHGEESELLAEAEPTAGASEMPGQAVPPAAEEAALRVERDIET